jgi:outer membrane lipoprotein SlyB
MNKMNQSAASVLVLTGALALGACENMNAPPYGSSSGVSTPPSQTSAYSTYGVVQAIEVVRQDSAGTGIGGSGIGLGTIAGAVVGGVAGNQVGEGAGNTAATVLGAAGGAYIGHELENRQRQQQQADAYKITVRMEDGSYQSVMHGTAGDFRVGDRVRIRNGVMERY